MSSSESITFVASAPGKLILAGEHSVVHYTRALASVIDKRTFAEFIYTHTPASKQSDASAPVLSLRIITNQMNEEYQWTREELLASAATLLSSSTSSSVSTTASPIPPTTLTSIPAYLDTTLKPALHQIPHAVTPKDVTKLNPTPAVFLMYFFAVLRPRLEMKNAVASSEQAFGTLSVTVTSELPIGAGLGSSASFTSSLSTGFVWLARRLAAKVGKIEGDYLGPNDAAAASSTAAPSLTPLNPCINAWAYEGERIIHGNPSGLDNTTVVYGGVVLYRKVRPEIKGADGTITQEAKEGLMKPLTNIPTLSLLVVNTRVPRNTAQLVAGVGKLKQEDPVAMEKRFEEIEQLVSTWMEVLQPNASIAASSTSSSTSTTTTPSTSESLSIETTVSTLMQRNQQLLVEMSVSHDIITRVLTLAQSYSFPGKLTGAGGGGCLILLKPSTATTASTSEFITKLEGDLGCEVLETVVGQGGVRVEEGKTMKEVQEERGTATTKK